MSTKAWELQMVDALLAGKPGTIQVPPNSAQSILQRLRALGVDCELADGLASNQHPRLRRAYLIRPRAQLHEAILASPLAEDVEFLTQPTVAMTEALPYEDKLESYRSLILTKCKEAFLRELFEYDPLADELARSALLGDVINLTACFDRWWIAEEIDTIEIPRTW